MIWELDIALMIFLVILALSAVISKDLVISAVCLSAYSLIMAIVWLEMNAPDVAFTEAVVGGGVTTVILTGAIAKTERREKR
ncbi:MAG: hydrogenase subunit MbhD domain-containing protein [Candidatus Thermoplasmatota archaeon]|nr:hydrogenase subunit MbhD domain-containing protein [Candidatus Thermoplasmatota archaeon]